MRRWTPEDINIVNKDALSNAHVDKFCGLARAGRA